MTSFTTSTQIVAICLNQTVKLQKLQQQYKTNPINTVQSYVKKISRLKQGKKKRYKVNTHLCGPKIEKPKKNILKKNIKHTN